MSEMSDVFDCLSMLIEPVYIIGDVKVHLERLDDQAARELIKYFADRRLLNCVTSPTHDHGGMLDIVVGRSDLLVPCVYAVDIDLSDHCMLRWLVLMMREVPIFVSTSRRPWKIA